LGAVHRDAGRQDEAIREFQLASELAPGNAEAPRQLAEIYNTQGRFEEAEKLYLRAINARPTDWYGHMLLGLFYYERERYAEAEASLKQASMLAPDNDMVRRNLGAVYGMHGRYKEAIDEYQAALRIRTNALTYAALADVYFHERRFAEAVTAVETAIEFQPNDYRFWGNLGAYAKWTPGHEGKSAPALRKAIEMAVKNAGANKSDYSVHANLAEYYARLGNEKRALEEIGRIPETARGPLTTRLAVVYELTGRHGQAVTVIRNNLKSPASMEQIKSDPDLAPVWRDLQPR
jgi:tetratricopeptide (TPR) repeat protein